MNFNKSFFLAATFILSFVSVQGHEKKWPEKRLRQTWPSAQSFSSKQMSLTQSQISQLESEGVKIGSKDRSPTYYFVQEKATPTGISKTMGTILFIDEAGANGVMEISIAMGDDGKTKKIDIWEHSEDALITKDNFLNQFLGKTSKDTFIANKDYRPIENANKVSDGVARAVNKALKMTNLLFEKK